MDITKISLLICKKVHWHWKRKWQRKIKQHDLPCRKETEPIFCDTQGKHQVERHLGSTRKLIYKEPLAIPLSPTGFFRPNSLVSAVHAPEKYNWKINKENILSHLCSRLFYFVFFWCIFSLLSLRMSIEECVLINKSTLSSCFDCHQNLFTMSSFRMMHSDMEMVIFPMCAKIQYETNF